MPARRSRISCSSVQARLREARGVDTAFPEDGYQGEYIREIARDYAMARPDDPDGADLEAIRDFAVAALRREQDADIAAFGVRFDEYYLESSLYSDGLVDATVNALVAAGRTYEQDGALWLRTTEYGDDKDRVMRKSDGSYTYFVPDIAYHVTKWKRGFKRAITELGADHGGSLVTRPRRSAGARDGHPEGLSGLRAASDGAGHARRRGSQNLEACGDGHHACAN